MNREASLRFDDTAGRRVTVQVWQDNSLLIVVCLILNPLKAIEVTKRTRQKRTTSIDRSRGQQQLSDATPFPPGSPSFPLLPQPYLIYFLSISYRCPLSRLTLASHPSLSLNILSRWCFISYLCIELLAESKARYTTQTQRTSLVIIWLNLIFERKQCFAISRFPVCSGF